jgi:transposase
MLFWSKEYTNLSKKLVRGELVNLNGKTWCGIDPGIKNFITIYDNNTNVYYEKIKKDHRNVSSMHQILTENLLQKYDVIFFGDIKLFHPHLRFDLFKKRLINNAGYLGKKNSVIFIDESHTTKTCSSCGNLKSSTITDVYDCKRCGGLIDRDENAAKNILLKGLIQSGLGHLNVNKFRN